MTLAEAIVTGFSLGILGWAVFMIIMGILARWCGYN